MSKNYFKDQGNCLIFDTLSVEIIYANRVDFQLPFVNFFRATPKWTCPKMIAYCQLFLHLTLIHQRVSFMEENCIILPNSKHPSVFYIFLTRIFNVKIIVTIYLLFLLTVFRCTKKAYNKGTSMVCSNFFVSQKN